MPLTETENNILNLARKDSGAFSCVGGVNRLIELIDRLVAENEALKLEREVNMEMLNRYIDRCKFYEAKLDAIKKAWEPIQDLLCEHDEKVSVIRRDTRDDVNWFVSVGVAVVRTLDRLIGGKE